MAWDGLTRLEAVVATETIGAVTDAIVFVAAGVLSTAMGGKQTVEAIGKRHVSDFG